MMLRIAFLVVAIGAVAAAAYVFLFREASLPRSVTDEQLRALSRPELPGEFAAGTRAGNGAQQLLRAAELAAGFDRTAPESTAVLPQIAAAFREAAEHEYIDLTADTSTWPALLELKRRPELYARLDAVRTAMTTHADALWAAGRHDDSRQVTRDLGIVAGQLLAQPARLTEYDLAYDLLSDAAFRMAWIEQQEQREPQEDKDGAERWRALQQAAKRHQSRLHAKAGRFLWRPELRLVTGDLLAIAAGDGDRTFRVDAALLAGAAAAKLGSSYPQDRELIIAELRRLAGECSPYEAAAARRAMDVTVAEANVINLP